MSLNKEAYFAYHERLLEPDSIIVTGNYKQHKPTKLAEKWKWIDNLTPAERHQLKDEFDNEVKNLTNDW